GRSRPSGAAACVAPIRRGGSRVRRARELLPGGPALLGARVVRLHGAARRLDRRTGRARAARARVVPWGRLAVPVLGGADRLHTARVSVARAGGDRLAA